MLSEWVTDCSRSLVKRSILHHILEARTQSLCDRCSVSLSLSLTLSRLGRHAGKDAVPVSCTLCSVARGSKEGTLTFSPKKKREKEKKKNFLSKMMRKVGHVRYGHQRRDWKSYHQRTLVEFFTVSGLMARRHIGWAKSGCYYWRRCYTNSTMGLLLRRRRRFASRWLSYFQIRETVVIVK